MLRRLVVDESGQDLVEYSLLAALVGVSSLAAYSLISTQLGASYNGWDSQVQDLWEMCAPGQPQVPGC